MLNELEIYCRRDTELTEYMELWWDIYHWVKTLEAASYRWDT